MRWVMPLTPDSDGMTRSHWYWRPGWKVGRRFLTWHVTFPGIIPCLAAVVEHYRETINRMPHLAALEFSGLHLTMQGVGFTDEIDNSDLEQIVGQVRQRLVALAPVDVTLGPARTDAEGLFLVVEPMEAMHRLRGAVRSGIADVWGAQGVPEDERFSPHVTLAYSDDVVPLSAAQRELDDVEPMSVPFVIDHVTLVELHRDNRRYEWREVEKVPIGSATDRRPSP